MVVAVVGRPNVGKSTLFNRLIGRSLALVDSLPGVTRDRREGAASLGGMDFTVVDTAGLDEPVKKAAVRGVRGAAAEALAMEQVMADKGVLSAMLEQTTAAVRAASVVAFVVDVRHGISPWDEYYARWLRKTLADVPSPPHLLLIANKCEGSVADELMFSDELDNGWSTAAARRLGFGEPIYLSAEHGDGLAALYNALAPIHEQLAPPPPEPPAPAAAESDAPPADLADAEHHTQPISVKEMRRRERHERSGLRVAVVGRPNVGKSTLANNLLGTDRFVVGDMPGVTQDANSVHTVWRVPESHAHLEALGTPPVSEVSVTLVDTAGMMRPSASAKSTTPKRLASLAYRDALSAIRRANVVVLVADIKPSVRGDGFHNPHDPSRASRKRSRKAGAVARSSDDVESDDDLAYKFEFDTEQTVFSPMDASIAKRVADEGRGLVVAVNKWDLLGAHGLPRSVDNPHSQLPAIVKHLESKLAFVAPYQLRDAPWVGISAAASMASAPAPGELAPVATSFDDLSSMAALSPQTLLVPEILSVYDGWNMRLPTGALNEWLAGIVGHRSAPGKVRYITQVDSRPPKFVLFAAKRGSSTHWAGWIKFLTNEMRAQFGLYGVPIRIAVRNG
ncbi:GTP-binding protein engA [Thecamonas trahens ATCC 50062]|uniref:GTP-binding protein engA n=1 Tax=Thecamonas trahens ATCC 50062 TaxID=461836 RepID=A0A0L0DJM3_THETB|nr:GTP-binding protein engA [Thecamonas trahens ATCC 50062]KNC52405.1 GTP-binding protein engA [Thecamonas trahens ATCC 50062]|eukprot:XP_013755448.1 GTP-binding protein engA [Thecamonas trahens ATCC 50062]